MSNKTFSFIDYPFFGIKNAHLQTILPSFIRTPRPAYERERWDTPDDDFIDVDWVNRTSLQQPNQRLIVLFHGLEGSSNSSYARALMDACQQNGHTGAVVHWRSCSGEANRQVMSYHSGASDEINWILKRFSALAPNATRHAVGVSLGGNALLKWLGEQGESAQSLIQSAVAVCPPHDLKASSVALASGFNQRVYMKHFLSTLIHKGLAKAAAHPHLNLNIERIKYAQNFNDIDEYITAPLHGFKGAEDYWAHSSCKPFLRNIHVPTLVINALDDPLVPAASLAQADEISRFVHLAYSKYGGHVGFLSGRFVPKINELPQRILAFFKHY